MDYRTLLDKIKEYCDPDKRMSSGQEIYRKSIESEYVDWERMSRKDVENVFEFLNRWGMCRLERKYGGFIEAYKMIRPLLRPFRELRLEHFNPDELVHLRKEHTKAHRVIHIVFDELASVKGFGPVPTSKTLHIFSPALFPMWDRAICIKLYGLRPSGHDYANIFLPKMQSYASEVINDVMKRWNMKRPDAIDHICSEIEKVHGFPVSLAKAIDEYNFVTAPRPKSKRRTKMLSRPAR